SRVRCRPCGGASDLAEAATAKAAGPFPPRPKRDNGAPPAPPSPHTPPPPPGAPGTPAAPAAPAAPGPSGTPYVPTQLVPQTPPAAPGTPPPSAPPSVGGFPASGAPFPPPGATPPLPAGGYGFPQPTVPTVGPGYLAVLRYRTADGTEQQVMRRSAPGTPHPEWQILHELRSMNVPPQQVLELHTELEPCDLPGAYCARMIRETWPQARLSHTAAYGRDHASRRQGMRHLIEHQGELHQVAEAPARPAPNRAPLPGPGQFQPVPPAPPQAVAQELAQSFPQGVHRFDQRAVARQGVPEVVAQTLVWSGLPVDFGPFFWAEAHQGRPVPTLAELAQERGVQPAPDAGSYLVMGNDFGRQLCVQYGTAHIVAVPLEAAPGGQAGPVQFVNSGLPEFVRCLALLGRMWRWRYGLTPEQAGRWTVDFQAQLLALDPPALEGPDHWWSVVLEQFWDGLL
ncbi:SUKH-4 family immunity protein, partial [Streptomyces polyrhachis]